MNFMKALDTVLRGVSDLSKQAVAKFANNALFKSIP